MCMVLSLTAKSYIVMSKFYIDIFIWKLSNFLEPPLVLTWGNMTAECLFSGTKNSVVIMLQCSLPGKLNRIMSGLLSFLQDLGGARETITMAIGIVDTTSTIPVFYCRSRSSSRVEWGSLKGFTSAILLSQAHFCNLYSTAGHIHVWVKRIIVKTSCSSNTAAFNMTLHLHLQTWGQY